MQKNIETIAFKTDKAWWEKKTHCNRHYISTFLLSTLYILWGAWYLHHLNTKVTILTFEAASKYFSIYSQLVNLWMNGELESNPLNTPIFKCTWLWDQKRKNWVANQNPPFILLHESLVMPSCSQKPLHTTRSCTIRLALKYSFISTSRLEPPHFRDTIAHTIKNHQIPLP